MLISIDIVFFSITPIPTIFTNASVGRELGVADLGYDRLNMQVIETSIHKTSGFLSDFFHTLVKQRRELFILNSGEDRVFDPASCSRSQILRQLPTGSLGTSASFLTYWYKVLHK
ncbi:hypothetical protein [Microcoleus sp. Pol12B5]|uniref:hypothetical protein n=1 Tax=unclassified Microcoleus TaxID=2642155 RepID=UPI002FD07F40